MTLKNVSMKMGDHWGLTVNESAKPWITIGTAKYCAYGGDNCEFRSIEQNSWYPLDFEKRDLLPDERLTLTIEIDGHSPDYIWTYEAFQWFYPQSIETSGQETNANGKPLMWRFTVEET
jgi:hypothetical protein